MNRTLINQGPAYALPRPYLQFTESDQSLMQDIMVLRQLRRKNAALYKADTIMSQPPNSLALLKTNSVAVSTMVASTTYTLFNFRVPDGFYGVLKNRGHWVDGAGFVEGSGTLRWALAIGDGWAYDQGQMLYTIGPDHGTDVTAEGGGILIRPNQNVTYTVSTGADITPLDANAIVIARIKGWYVPING
jgi:hypothetical protein